MKSPNECATVCKRTLVTGLKPIFERQLNSHYGKKEM